MLRSLRALRTARASGIRKYSDKSPLQTAFSLGEEEDEEKRYRTEKNPVIPNVENIQDRWNKLDAGAQDDIIAYLEDKSRGDWRSFTLDERRAMWYIYFGPWGPRAPNAGKSGNGYNVYAALVGGSTVGLIAFKLWDDSRSKDPSTCEATTV